MQTEITSINKLASDLVDDSSQTNKFVTTSEKTTWNNKSDFSGSYNDLSNKPTIPTKTSDLSNDSGFITNAVNDLTNYYKKTETYTQAEVNSLIGAISTMDIRVVETLPTQDISTTTIYLVPKQTAGTNDSYDEYIYVSNSWEHIGSTDVDLSGYQTKIDSSHKLSADLVDDTNQVNKFVTASEKQTWNNKSDFSGDYDDLTNKPTIPVVPTNVSAFTNDAGYLTQHQDISGKQDKLTAGANIDITNNVISATDTTYTAGTGIDITNNVISNTQTSAEWGNITGTLSNQTDLNTALGNKQDTLVSGTNIKTINNTSILGSGNITVSGGNEIYIGDEQDAPATTKLLIEDDTVGFIATPENTYTTTETRVGTWIDGKPIYRKVFQGTSTSSSRAFTIPKNNISLNLDEIVFLKGHTVQPSGNFTGIPYYIDSGDYTQWYYTTSNNGNVNIVTGASHGFGTHYVVIEYTKTTD